MGCQEEAEYKWFEAARLYEQELESESPSGIATAESWQKIGFCYDLASRQAKNVEEFKSLRGLGISAYERAADFYKENKQEYSGKSEYCLANAEYLRSWLASDSSEKIKILDKCREIAKKAITAFRTVGNDLYYGQTANLLLKILYDRMSIASSATEKNEICQEAMDVANEAISILSKLDNKDELLLAFSLASIQYWYAANIEKDEKERTNLANKSVDYADNAISLLSAVQNPYLQAISCWAGVYSYLYFKDDIEISIKYAKQLSDQALVLKDNYLMGIASYLLAYVTDWKIQCEEHPDKKRDLYDKILNHATKSIRSLGLVFQDSFIAECYTSFIAQVYCDLASDYSVNISEKLVYSRKALASGTKGLEYAVRSGTPESMLTSLHILSKVNYYLSNLEPEKARKPELLREALKYRSEYLKIAETNFPANTWMSGVSKIYAGQIKRDRSRIEQTEKAKISGFEDAIASMDNGVSSCKEWIASCDVPTSIATVAGFEDILGRTLDEAFVLTTNSEHLTRANEVYNGAIEDFKKVDLPSRVAESYWKIAKNLDLSTSYELAAKNFENAYAAFKVTARKISQFSDFYFDYASYMKAWSEIEFAKYAHNEENFEGAAVQYEKASQLLRKSKSWMYLSSNFYAWSLLEQAEDSSRKENSVDAIEGFEKVIKFLQESKRLLSYKIGEIDRSDERDLVRRVIQVSDMRSEFSRGRIALEEAKLLDKKGDHVGSSDKYDKAAAIFQKISLEDSGQIGREAKPLSYLCQAWGKMMMAEARASPIMFEEAADLFELAKEHTIKESAGLMALGHSSFCKALEAGTEFEITRSMTMYEEATRNIETAAGLYLKAGFETSSNYVKATKLLFDAYAFMENAKRERETEKKVKYYSRAEEVLDGAAEYFEKGFFEDKAVQTQGLLQKVREERQFELSMSEIFHAPAVTSSTASFSAMAATEDAAGMERFEGGDVQVKIVQQETETKVGVDVELVFQTMNVGKEAVSLIRIEGLVPEGFQLVSKPDYCQLEDSRLTMKGKRLDPLRTDEMKFTLRAFKTGTIEIKPQLVCLDWIGHEKSYNTLPVVFNVSGAVLPGRVPTGCADLDNLLFGGIPETYAVVLSSPSSNEREQLIRRFLEVGVKKGQTTFYVTSEVGNVADLIEDYQSSFFVFVCNPRADLMIRNLPNVIKLKGVESLTELDIALLKSFRSLDQAQKGPRRLCITILSDVLLQHRAVTARKWLSGVLPDLKSKGFTTLAVVNPEMHPRDEVQAILGLFEGEIRVSEKESEKGLEKVLRIRKLYGQRYLENEMPLSREKLEC